MNPVEIEEQILPYLKQLAESPPVQAEIEAATAAIISIVESQSLSVFQRIIRWIKNQLKRGDNIMSGNAKITVKNSSGVLSGVAVSYLVNSVTTSATTDSTGGVEIDGLPAGTYAFTAMLTGYKSNSLNLSIAEGTTATGTIKLDALDNKTIAKDVEQAATDAAKTAAQDAINSTITTITSTSTDTGKSLLELAQEKITELTKEIGTTSSEWVKIRNSAEIGLFTILIAGASAGVEEAIKDLSAKVK